MEGVNIVLEQLLVKEGGWWSGVTSTTSTSSNFGDMVRRSRRRLHVDGHAQRVATSGTMTAVTTGLAKHI
jgi:hypothetical protein